jgi:DNA-binding NtrC family response regulator
LKKPFISIVDDDSGFANYLRTFLSLRGYETRSYSRGDEIVASIKQGDPPDVVLLDVMMPGMNGLETLRALKTAKPDLQVIMLSGREQASTIVEAVRLGAADYVVKPDDPEGLGEIALDAAIKSAIEKTRLVSEITELRRQLSDDQDRAFLFWGDSPDMQTIASVIEQVSDSDVTVLIRGESGVGKELVARAIHQRSSRKDRPFVKVNCAALPAELLESELFWHEKGAFTGAATTRIGKFEQADTGTIFLDEIAEMKAALQAKMLHVLQDAQFTKLGSNKPINVDVRVVAATNRDLEAMMLRGEFREDLYYRLKVIEVTVPPLRERRSEITHLTQFFIDRYARRYNRPVRQLTNELQQQFMTSRWSSGRCSGIRAEHSPLRASPAPETDARLLQPPFLTMSTTSTAWTRVTSRQWLTSPRW